MYLVDTNVLSESRKGAKAAPGVVDFLRRTENLLYLPVQVIGELEAGVAILRHRGDLQQAQKLERWVEAVLDDYSSRILPFDAQGAKIWGVLRGASNQNLIDKQIAAIALQYGLTVATRNTLHFVETGVALFNPFLCTLSREES
jgi:hypothetical protein